MPKPDPSNLAPNVGSTRKRDRFFPGIFGGSNRGTSSSTPPPQSIGPGAPVASAPPPAVVSTSLSGGTSPISSSPINSSLSSSTKKPKDVSKKSSTPIIQAELNPTIFPMNILRTVKIPLPKIGHRIKNTPQLAHCATLLRVMGSPSFSIPSPPSLPTVIDGHPLRTEDWDWMTRVEKEKAVEKDRIQNLVVDTVSEFISSPTKGSDAIREIVLLGPALEREHFQDLLNCLLSNIESDAILGVGKLQGAVQLVQDAPPGCLEVDNLIRILEIVRKRLEVTSLKSDDLVFHLTLAISRVLNVMADMKIKDLHRVKQHDPLRTVLAGLKSGNNPFLRYQAIYAAQALRCVPDDETRVGCFLRLFMDLTGGLIKVSALMRLNIDGFAGGVQDIQKNIKDIYDIVKSGIEDTIAMKDDVKKLGSSLRSIFESEPVHPWYMSLRLAEKLVQTGHLADLRVWVWQALSHKSYLFQWGICQILGDIAIDPSWDEDTRGQAILFLGEIFENSAHDNVKRWIVTIFDHISTLSTLETTSGQGEEIIKIKASNTRDQLSANGMEVYPFPYLLGRRLPLPSTSSVLRKASKMVDVEPALLKIKIKIKIPHDTFYIPLKSRESLQGAGGKLIDLDERVTNFLRGEKQIMLILGDSGAGKSTFNRHLECRLWSQYQPDDSIPLFIDLKTIGKLDGNDIVRNKWTAHGLNDDQIRELMEYRHIVLICDGYDEYRQQQWVILHDLLTSNGWTSFKIVVTCRIQYLPPNYKMYFDPRLDGSQTVSQASDLYDEAVIAPFGPHKIEKYIQKFRKTENAKDIFKDRAIWSTQEYNSRLVKLQELVKNPLMLYLALITLPNIAASDLGNDRTKVTRFRLYEVFVKKHFERGLGRLAARRGKMETMEEDGFKLIERDFDIHGIYLSMRLAHSIFMKQEGDNSVEYSTMDNKGWKAQFFGPKAGADTKLLLEASQVKSTLKDTDNPSSGPQTTVHSFSHRSILEFFYACRLCDYTKDPSGEEDSSETTPYSYLTSCLESGAVPSLLIGHPLNQRRIVSESSVVHFLAERATADFEFKEQLQSIIKRSKTDEAVATAAANAITILVMAGERFNGADLRGIRIPGADVSGGQFDSAQLEDADLTEVNLSRSWVRQADFFQARMSGVQFGEKPSIKYPGMSAMALSPKGEYLALGFESGEVRVLDTANFNTLDTLRSHSYKVSHLAFSSSGRQIASGSQDTTIRIWDWQQKTSLPRILRGHSSEVNGVAFSPNGRWLSSVADDMSVRVWDLELDTIVWVLESHGDEAWCTAWSPNEQQIASGGKDGAVYLWQQEYGELERPLWFGNDGRDTEYVCSVTYSHDGQRLAAAVGNNILVWDLQTTDEPIVLEGHRSEVRAVSFSQNGQLIASASLDESVGIWDGRTGALVRRLSGSDSGCIIAVAFWKDQEIISFDSQGTLRFWELSHGADRDEMLGIVAGPLAERHRDFVETVAYSRDGKKIFSGGRDNCIREWDSETGESRVVAPTHTNILHIAVSPENNENQQIAVVAHDEAPILLKQVEGSDDTLDAVCHGTYSAVAIAYSPCGRWIVSGAPNGILALMDRLESNTEEQLLEGHVGWISGIEFSLDGEQFITWSKDQSVRVWESKSGDCIDAIDIFIESLTFSPCGTMIAWSVSVETDENGLNISDTHPDIHLTVLQRWRKDVHVLKGHRDLVCSMAWTSEWIVSGSYDRTVRLWKEHRDSEMGTRRWSCAAILHDIAVWTLAWNPYVSSLEFVTGGHDSSVCVWTVKESDQKGKGIHDSWQATIQLKWGSIDRLETRGARITGALGLDPMQKKLLLQHGSIDDAVADDGDEGEEEEEEEALVRRFRHAEVTDIAPQSEEWKPEEDEEDVEEDEEEEEVLTRRVGR